MALLDRIANIIGYKMNNNYYDVDNNECPALRDENCLNCGHSWGDHAGWRCPISSNFGKNIIRKSELAPNERYHTSDMKDDWNDTVMEKTKSHICPCGIIRQDCDYHKLAIRLSTDINQ